MRKLGKLAPKHDPRDLHLARYLDAAKLPPLAPAVDWSHVIDAWGMALNDQLGCCVISAAAHAIEEWSAANGQEVPVSDAQVLASYEAIAGYDPADPNTDRGTVMADALSAWRRAGIAGNQLGAFVSLGVHDAGWIDRVRASVALFGASYFGLALPESIEHQGKSWGVPAYGPRRGPRGDGTPGSLGGHCVLVTGYHVEPSTRRLIFSCISWGEVYTFSGAFAQTYCDEAFALLDPLWTDGTRSAPSGFALDALRSDIAALQRP